MLMNAAILASLMAISLGLIFKKLPKKLQKFLINHPLMTDILVTFGLIGSFGTTATVIIAAAMVDAIIGCALYIAAHPTDYAFINDYCQMMTDMLKKIRDAVNEYGRKYNEEKALEEAHGQ